jgi:hypothetical protein
MLPFKQEVHFNVDMFSVMLRYSFMEDPVVETRRHPPVNRQSHGRRRREGA